MRREKTHKKKKRSARKTADPAAGRWQIQTAKARFSELLRQAQVAGPQVVTKQGRDEVVIVPIQQYKQLTSANRKPKSLARFFAESPLAGVDLDLTREPDFGRDINL